MTDSSVNDDNDHYNLKRIYSMQQYGKKCYDNAYTLVTFTTHNSISNGIFQNWVACHKFTIHTSVYSADVG